MTSTVAFPHTQKPVEPIVWLDPGVPGAWGQSQLSGGASSSAYALPLPTPTVESVQVETSDWHAGAIHALEAIDAYIDAIEEALS